MLQLALTGQAGSPLPVELETDDGLMLHGVVDGAGPAWALVFHDAGDDLDEVRPLAPVLGRAGWSTLLLDSRGHGLSEGEWDVERAAGDVAAATRFASARGAQEVSLVAFGETVEPVLRAAPELEPRALVLVSPPTALDLLPRQALASARPRLIVVGGHDPTAHRNAQTILRRAIGPRMLVQLPTAAQSTALLRERLARQMQSQILTFLTRARSVG